MQAEWSQAPPFAGRAQAPFNGLKEPELPKSVLRSMMTYVGAGMVSATVQATLTETEVVFKNSHEVNPKVVLLSFRAALIANLLKFPFFEVLFASLTAQAASPLFGGMLAGAIFATVTLPMSNFLYRWSMKLPVRWGKLYEAYLPTLLRDVAYGLIRSYVTPYAMSLNSAHALDPKVVVAAVFLACLGTGTKEIEKAATAQKKVEDFAALRCNFPVKNKKTCGAVIKEGVFLRCRHLLCKEHAQEWFLGSDECPVCRDGICAKRRHVGRADDRERLKLLQELLVTSSPLEVQEAAAVALELWEGQKAEEFGREIAQEQELIAHVNQLNRTIRKRLTEAESVVKSQHAKTEDLRRQVAEAERNLRQDRECASRLQSRIQQLHRASEQKLSDAAGLTPSKKRLRSSLFEDAGFR
ncbi:rsmF [Symbiodinium pilosum]|uniref:RsmF protein n=1 Tax=Symbiodinium pilosum TaxID=2952 RepID=A0A812XHZ4_SYMPI|nr:rsmF [Symbiodinium pilosum]